MSDQQLQTAERLADAINNRKWTRIGGWRQAPLFAWSNITGRAREFNLATLGFDFEFKDFLYWFGKGYFLNSTDYRILREFFESNLRTDPYWFRNYEAIVSRVSQAMIDYSKPFVGKSFAGSGKDELLNVFRGWYRCVNLAQPVLEGYELIGDLIEERIRSELTAYLRRRQLPEDLLVDYIATLNVPKNEIGTVREQKELMEIASWVRKAGVGLDSPEVRRRLDEHLERWRWIPTHHFIGDPYEEGYFWERLSALVGKDCEADLSNRRANAELHEKACEQREAELRRTGEEGVLVDFSIARDLAYLKPFRVDAYYIAWTNLWGLFSEIGRRVRLTVDQLMNLTDQEIEAAIVRGVVDGEVIDERSGTGGFAVVKIDGRLELMSGARFASMKSKVQWPDFSGLTEVRGVVAWPGTVRGRATVLHSENDIPSVREGDVMVIAMTDPNYEPAMSKASAFVTDFGNLLCHAEIVARELDRSCVIRTSSSPGRSRRAARGNDRGVSPGFPGRTEKECLLQNLIYRIRIVASRCPARIALESPG